MEWLEDVTNFNNLDCGDSSCKYAKRNPGGMRTNGGRRCSRNHSQDVERFLLRNYNKALIKIQELQASIEVENMLK